MRFSLVWSVAWCVATAMGCTVTPGLGGSSSSSGGVAGEQACADIATAFCNRYSACADFYIPYAFGDLPTCISRIKTAFLCPTVFTAADTTVTPNMYAACALALPTVDCLDLFVSKVPAACTWPAGPRADGQRCGFGSQCAGDVCRGGAGGCGTCTTPSQAGGLCSSPQDCVGGSYCSSTGVCVLYGGQGATCDANHACNPRLACRGGTCATRLSGGATCSPQEQPCDLYDEALACSTTTNRCTAVTQATAGAMCGFAANGTFAICTEGAACRPSASNGTCIAPAADGDTCNATTGAPCLYPASCDQGACTLPSAQNCN